MNKFIALLLPCLLCLQWFASAAEFDIRDDAEFRKCVPADAKLENIAGDLGFPEGGQWIPRDSGFFVFSDVKNSRIQKWTKAGVEATVRYILRAFAVTEAPRTLMRHGLTGGMNRSPRPRGASMSGQGRKDGKLSA